MPCRGIKLPEVTPLRCHVVDAVEVARLANELGLIGSLEPMVYLGTVDGLRWGEVAGPRVRQLDLEASTLAVTETVVRGRKGVVGFGEPWSAAGRRTLAVPAELTNMLCEHLGLRGVSTGDADAPVFTSPDGSVLRYSNGLARLVTVVRRCGLGADGEGHDGPRVAGALGLATDARPLRQVVTELREAAAAAMGARFLGAAPHDKRAMEAGSGCEQGRPRTRREGL